MRHVDETSVPDNFFASATAWRPAGLGVACAIDIGTLSTEEGEKGPDASWLDISMHLFLELDYRMICSDGIWLGLF